MKKIKGNITITRTTSSKRGDFISIHIRDIKSSLCIMNVEIELKQFALLITGLGFQDCNIEIYDNYKILGKKRILQIVLCEKVYEKEKQKKIVLKDYDEKYKDKWEIWDDGTSTQQNSKDHHYLICKYVEEK